MATPTPHKPELKPSDDPWLYSTKPTRGTLFMRTFLPWQLWRFIQINLKMVTIIRRSHSAH